MSCGCRNRHKPDVFHRHLVAPEILPAGVAATEPDSRMHDVVVERVDSLHGRMIAIDLPLIRQPSVREVRPQELVVTKHEVDDRLTAQRGPQAVLLLVDATAVTCRS